MAENQVSISSADRNPNFLSPKLQAGNGIALTDNGNFIRIDSLVSGADHQVSVDSADGSPGYLSEKLQAGPNISLANTGSTVKISADTQTGDHKVIVDGADSSPDYLSEKIKAGSNVSITNQGNYLEISSTDTGMINPMTSYGDLIIGGAAGEPSALSIGSTDQVLTVTSGAPAWKTIPTQTGDHKVLVDSSDTNPQYLGVKLKSGAGVNISYYNHDKMEIASLGQCKVALLGTMDYLGNKILQGSGITLTKTDNDITIAANTQTGDHKTIVDGSDTTPGYLSTKITAGSNVSITNTGSALQVSATDTVWPDPMTTKGDIVFENASLQPDRLGIGTSGQVLTVDSGLPSWKTIPTQEGDHKVCTDGTDTANYLENKIEAGSNVSITKSAGKLVIASTDTGFANPMTAKGDLIIGANSGTPIRMAMGTAGQILTSLGSDIGWTSPDHKVLASSTDTSADYLVSKLTAGSNVSITNNGTSLEISATDTGFANPMTAVGDLIVGGTSGAPTRLAKGYQGQVLKVGSSGLEWSADTGFDNPMEEQGDLILGSYDGVASRLPIGTVNQFLFSNGTTAEWATLPLNIDWVVPPALANGEFNQAVDRTFYVRVYPSLQMRSINHVAILLNSSVAGDVWRVAVFDSSRNMVSYGESTGSASAFQRIALTQLQPWTPGTNNYYYLAVSMHTSGSTSSKIKTASVTGPSYCWYEDVALTSGRAMPATSNLTASSSKVPIIGLRGR